MKTTLRSGFAALVALLSVCQLAWAQAPAGCQPSYLTNAAPAAGGLTAEYYQGSFRDNGSNRVGGDAVTGLPFFQRLPDLRRNDATVNFADIVTMSATRQPRRPIST